MKKTIPLLAILMAELCLATPLVAATARTATENFVTNKIAAAISQIPPPDFSTNNAALVATIESTAPAPGDYAAVSNAAVYAAITNALQDAALAGKATKADATLTKRFSAWTFSDGGMHVISPAINGAEGWFFLLDDYNPSQTTFNTKEEAENSLVLNFPYTGGIVITATRTALSCYQLGSQTDKPLASEAEAEALRAGKRDYDDLSYTFALTDYPQNIFVVSNANIAGIDGEYTYTTPQDAMVPVVGWYKNSTASGLWFELSGSTITASGPTAVDLDASLAEQDVTMPIEGSSPPEYLTFHLLRRVPNDALALDSVKANDADVVHKTGDETIEGVKTFSNGIVSDYDIYNANGFITTMGVWLQDIASGYVGGDNYDDHLIHIRTATDTALGLPSGDVTIPRANGMVALTSDIDGKQDNLPYPTNAIPYAAISGKPSLATVATSGSYNDLSNKPTIPTVPTNVSAFNNDAGYLTGYTESDPTIKAWAKANTKPTYTASEVGAATAEDVYRIVAGTNVLLVVTNYNSAVHAPLMSLQHLDPDTGEYVVYWNESRRHGITLTNAMEHADAAVAAERERADAAYAPRAWSGTTSGLGAEAPSGVTWISTPETVIAGGYEYEKVVTSAGAVWVLASNGLTAGATTNGYFRIEASDGTELFSIEKTDSYLVGVPADGITRSGNTVTIPLNVVAPSHPYIRAATNIVNAVWTKEDENGFTCPFASVSWSGSSGAYVATVTCAEPQAFFYFEFMHEGTSKIRNSAATEMTGGIYYGGATYMPTVSGNELKFIRQ